MKGFTVPADLTRATSMSDGGMGVGFHTKEITADEKAKIMGFHMTTGWLLFSPNDINLKDVPTTIAEKDAKTPAQRLRAVLFIAWKQENDGKEFDEYYQSKMEGFINFVKNKLE